MKAAPTKGADRTLRRAFHWNVDAPDEEPFSVRWVPPVDDQIGGRFDNDATSVLYLAEQPEHAVAEVLRQFRGRSLRKGHLRRSGFPLAVVEVEVPLHIASEIVDLGDPQALLRFGLRADTLALPESERAVTQAVSRRIFDAGVPSLW